MNNQIRCKELLDKGRIYDVIHGDRLANHLPMALIALDKMGASLKQLDQLYEVYHSRLQIFEKAKNDVENDPLNTLGQNDRFAEHLSFFIRILEDQGIDEVLHSYLPALLPGISASAFHALIRLAYGLEADGIEEIAFGLAFWSSTYQPLGSLGKTCDNQLLLVNRLINMSSIVKEKTFQPGIIIDRMVEVSKTDQYQQLACQPEHLTLEQIAKIAIDAYLGTGNFTILHGVTGCHALRIILPWLDNQATALQYYWQAFVLAYLSTGAVPIASKEVSSNLESFDTLFSQIVTLTDVHDIKLLYTCWSEYQHYGWPEYQEVANAIFNNGSP